MKKHNYAQKISRHFLIPALTITMLAGQPAKLLAAERSYDFCNKGVDEAQQLVIQSTLPLLDVNLTLKGEVIPGQSFSFGPDAKTLTVKGVKILKDDCIKAKISTKAMGGAISNYHFVANGQKGEEITPDSFEGEDATSVLSDVVDLQNLTLEREAERSMAESRLATCPTPETCQEAKNEVVEASANAAAAEHSLNERLRQAGKYLIPAGGIALGIVGGLLVKQIVQYRNYLKALREKENCARLGGFCDEFEKVLRQERETLTKVGSEVNNQWGNVVTQYGQEGLKNPNPQVEIELPKYFEGAAPIANENVIVTANLTGPFPRDLRKLVMDIEGEKLPVSFLPEKGVVRVEIPNKVDHGEFKARLQAYGETGLMGEKEFVIRKDSTTPKVTISESGKAFKVNVSDSGLGFEGISMSGNNVKIDSPELTFEKKKNDFQTTVKMIKRPANLEVKAHKTVVRQNVRPLSNTDQVIGLNAADNIKYPEERTPKLPGLTLDELMAQIMGGRQIKGLCCRDSSCTFCHANDLLTCRQLGFSYWKFPGDPACYKIKPLP